MRRRIRNCGKSHDPAWPGILRRADTRQKAGRAVKIRENRGNGRNTIGITIRSDHVWIDVRFHLPLCIEVLERFNTNCISINLSSYLNMQLYIGNYLPLEPRTTRHDCFPAITHQYHGTRVPRKLKTGDAIMFELKCAFITYPGSLYFEVHTIDTIW